MNALGRIRDTYEAEINRTRRDLSLAESQLQDYQACHGLSFAHDGYANALTELRDALRLALAGKTEGGGPTAIELAEKITGLKASHALESFAAKTRATSNANARILRVSSGMSHFRIGLTKKFRIGGRSNVAFLARRQSAAIDNLTIRQSSVTQTCIEH